VNDLRVLALANADFARLLGQVGNDDWRRPTPCTEWDVRALVNHVIGGNRRFVLRLGGASTEEVERTRDIDHLGKDPRAAFASTARELEALFSGKGALERMAHHGDKEWSGAQLLLMRIGDLTVHSWDLARALDVDETLASDAVARSVAHFKEFASEAAAPPGTSPLAQLIELSGRPTDWRRP
jgi:uncharacterized protein (TIGR03086 family)